MPFFTISNGKLNERRNTGIQNVFYDGRDAFSNIEDQRDTNANSVSADVELPYGIKAIKQTRHYPFVSFRRQWQAWADKTTFHGVNIVFSKKARILRRLLWLALIIYMLVALCNGCLIQLNRYWAYKTLHKETIFYKEKLPFPSVTICNLNIFQNDTISDERDKHILRSMYMYPPNSTVLKLYPGSEYTKNVSVKQMFMDSAMTAEDMFKSCAFDRHYFINCSEILDARIVGTYFCHTVNPAGMNQPLETTMVGTEFGLKIVLSANQDKYFISDSASAGFKVSVHEQGEEPNIDQALAVGPGFSHYLSIRKHEYHHKTYPVKAFGDRECLDTTADSFKNHLKYTTEYSYIACQQECWNDYVYQICGCIGYSDIGNQSECNPFETIECYNDAFLNFASNQCSCAIPCHFTTYMTKLSSTYFPNANFFKQFYGKTSENRSGPHDIETLRQDILYLRVFFDSKVVTRHEQILEFNKEDLFSSFGGYLGLFIGASLVTLLEFVEHVFMSFVQCCFPPKEDKQKRRE